MPILSSIGDVRAGKAAAAAAAAAFFKSGSSLESKKFSVFADRGGRYFLNAFFRAVFMRCV